eukprot:1282398-Rhodomonas_salina.3
MLWDARYCQHIWCFKKWPTRICSILTLDRVLQEPTYAHACSVLKGDRVLPGRCTPSRSEQGRREASARPRASRRADREASSTSARGWRRMAVSSAICLRESSAVCGTELAYGGSGGGGGA